MIDENIFADPRWRWASEVGYPNRVYGDGEIGAVVVVQAKFSNDFALSIAALKYVAEAEAAGRIQEGYVVLAQRNGRGNPEFVAAERVKTVAERLQGVDPSPGQWGEYHWITTAFVPANSARGGAAMPF